MVGRTAILISMFERGMTCLNTLVRERNVAARNSIQIGFVNLHHFELQVINVNNLFYAVCHFPAHVIQVTLQPVD